MTGQTEGDVREDLPPSPSYVLDVLERDGPLTLAELRETVYLPDRTLDWALRRLLDEDLIAQTRETDDLRRVSYNTCEGPDV